MKKTALFIVMLLIGGCQTLNDLANQVKKPTLSIEDVRVTGFSFNELSLVYDIKVDNPNAASITMTGYDYRFDINGSEFLTGKHDRKVAINSKGENIVEVPVTVNFSRLYRAIEGIVKNDESDYRFLSTLRFDLPALGQTNIPVQKQGNIPMVKMPTVSMKDISVESLSLSGAELAVDFRIDNPNGFGMEFNTLDYNLKINSDRWASGTAMQGTWVKANAVSELRIPISLDIGQVGMSAYRLLSGSGSVNYRVDGNISVNALHELLGTADIAFDRSGSISINR